MQSTESLSPVIDWCYDAVQGVSRTFAITVNELDEPFSREICIGYLLCRIPDTIEDATHIPPGVQSELLTAYSQLLKEDSPTDLQSFDVMVDEWVPDDQNADWELVQNTDRVFAGFEALDPQSRDVIRPAVVEMVDGMVEFVERYEDSGGLRIQTMGELEEYCWYVAGTVGMLVTGLLSAGASPTVREKLHTNARAFGVLLQLVNITKDMVEDFDEENNVYVPESVLTEHDVTVEDIDSAGDSRKFVGVVNRMAKEASDRLDQAQKWLEAMPLTRGNTMSAWAIPYLLEVGTLREIKASPEEVVSNAGVKVSREEVGVLLERFSQSETASVGELRGLMESKPLHLAR